jgi:hypothetical protein
MKSCSRKAKEDLWMFKKYCLKWRSKRKENSRENDMSNSRAADELKKKKKKRNRN